MRLIATLVTWIIFGGGTAYAVDFESNFLAFKMPENFVCQKARGIYTCQSSTGPRMKEEIIVVTFKRAGPQDTLEQYKSQMSQPRSIRNKDKISEISKVLSTQSIAASGTPWVESKHMNGEVIDYFTSYWATKVGGVAMLVSYSAHKSKQAQWQSNSQAIQQSLTVNTTAAQAAEKSGAGFDGPSGPSQLAGGPQAGPGSIQGPLPGAGDIQSLHSDQKMQIGPLSVTKKQMWLGLGALVALLLLGVALKR